LIASFTEISKTVHGLLAVLEAKAPDLFKDLSTLAAPVAAVEPVAPAPAPAAPPPAAPAPVHFPAPVAAQPQLLPLVQQLRESSLPIGCVADFAQVLKEDGFSMGKFVKELPPAVAKVKVKLKSPFGKPKDDDKTDVGLSVGCIKSLPESPAEIQGLLKDIALKAGLDFVVEAVENVVEEEKVEKKGVRFGVRAGYNINNFSFGYTEFDEEIKNGFGVGVGLALNVPIVSIISLNTGLDLYYRKLFGGRIKVVYFNLYGLEEVAISIPILLQFGNSFYFATGIQLDIPVSLERGDFVENRWAVDVGFVLGLGYMFKNFGFDFKYVYGLTGLIEDFGFYSFYDSGRHIDYKDKSWLGQYCFGVVYFF
jgi:hypothetical protein